MSEASRALKFRHGSANERDSRASSLLTRGVVDRCTIEWLIRRVHRMGGSVTLSIELGDAGRAWLRERFWQVRARRQDGVVPLAKPGATIEPTGATGARRPPPPARSLIPNLELR
jgi:hypothetical protein